MPCLVTVLFLMVIALGKPFGSRDWVLMTGSLPSLTHTLDSSSPEQYFTFPHEDTYPLLCRPLTQPTLCSWGLAFLHLAKLPVICKLGDFTMYSLRPEGFQRFFYCILKLWGRSLSKDLRGLFTVWKDSRFLGPASSTTRNHIIVILASIVFRIQGG